MAERRWYRLHWATWLTLLLVGGSLGWFQFAGFYGVSYHVVAEYIYGWPLVAVTTSVRSIGLELASERTFYWLGLVLDAGLCLVIMSSTGHCVERRLRAPRRVMTYQLSELLVVIALAAASLAFIGAERQLPEVIAGPPLDSAGVQLVYGTRLAWQPLFIQIPILFGLGCTIYAAGRLVVQAARHRIAGKSL